MQDSGSKEISYWNRCRCGVVWQPTHPENIDKFYGKKYIKALQEDKEKYSDSCFYYSRTYAPIIEELTYGRKILDVGYTSPYNMQSFGTRGWIPFGIDFNEDSPESQRLIKGNFEHYEFPKDDDNHTATGYDLIWLNHVIENFKDPVKSFKKCYELLNDSGCLFIATPDTDMIITNSASRYEYWRERECYIMWSMDALIKQLEQAGFEVILKRRNHEIRYTYTNDLHIIAQRRFF